MFFVRVVFFMLLASTFVMPAVSQQRDQKSAKVVQDSTLHNQGSGRVAFERHFAPSLARSECQ